MMYATYFKCAVWFPAILVPFLLVLDAVYFSRRLEGGAEQFFLIYVLGFGLAGYVVFASFVSRMINVKPEKDVVRLVWWAPVIFIPFYGAPWMLYGIGYLAFGRVAGFGMLFLWLGYLPYVLAVAAIFSIVSILLFKLISLGLSRRD